MSEPTHTVNPPPAVVLRDPVHFLAFGFGRGLVPKAPGTFGTLAALPFLWLSAAWPLWAQGLLVLAVCLAGFWICDESARRLDTHDHPGIVWDEIAGWLLAMLVVPFTWYWLLAGFLIFRFFDIVKPWPIGMADRRLKGGVGIMADDLLAGAFTALVLLVLAWGATHVL
jgi:phosphatidylglycerophosphatase A